MLLAIAAPNLTYDDVASGTLPCHSSVRSAMPKMVKFCRNQDGFTLGRGIWLGLLAGILPIAAPALAQIIPDDTLGGEPSQVIPLDAFGATADVIDGGARRGGNLFHSFRAFNVGEGRSVLFRNASNDLHNILARVTGNRRSEILGALGVLNDAGITSNPNLFLINPNGIIFGPNASLNVGGSFVATTASAIGFGDTGLFSATAPQTSALLAINPSALVFNQQASQPISITSRLQVPDGRSLLLVGGNLDLNGSALAALGGTIELVSLAGTGTAGLTINDNTLNLTLPAAVPRSDVTVRNGAIASVFGNSGSITVDARHLTLSEGSIVAGGISSGLGGSGGQAGDINVNATGTIRLEQASSIVAGVDTGAIGNGGNIRITTGSLLLTDGSQLGATIAGQGTAGNIRIDARDLVALDGVRTDGISGGIATGVLEDGIGDAGNVTIRTGSLTVTNGAVIGATTLGQGNAGNVAITARDRVALQGRGSNDSPSQVSTIVAEGATGNAGNVTIRTGSLTITNGATLLTATVGTGNGGNVAIAARDQMLLRGTNSENTIQGIVSNVDAGGVGNAGTIRLRAGTLRMTDGAGLVANTSGRGNAGRITVNVRDAALFDSGSGLLASVTDGGVGNAGRITVTAQGAVVFRDSSGAFGGVFPNGAGNASDVEIKARSLTVDDATLFAATFGGGNAGNVTLTADAVVVRNGATVGAAALGGGRAGNVTIEAHDTITINGRSQLTSAVAGQGQGGSLIVNAGSTVSIAGGAQLTAAAIGTGRAGSVTIRAGDRVSVDRSQVNVGTRGGRQRAGNLAIAAPTILLQNRGNLNATSDFGRGGNIRLASASIVLRRRSQISARSLIRGQDGNVGIDTNFLVAVPVENSDIIAASPPRAGSPASNINIRADGVYGIGFQTILTPESDITATGTVTISPPDVDPNRGLVALPTNVVDATNLVAQGCSAERVATADSLGEFIVTGRGGLPPNPAEVLSHEDPLTPWVVPPDTAHRSSASVSTVSQSVAPVVEAQGWGMDNHGNVVLTAQPSAATFHPAAVNTAICPT